MQRRPQGDGEGPSRLRGSDAGTPERIAAAAIRLVDSPRADGALTLRAVAREAGITAPAVYTHYADLSAVRAAVLAASFSELRATIAAAAASEDAPERVLVAACEAYVRFGWAHRTRFRLMFAADGFAPAAVDSFALVETALARCVDAGRSTSRDPHGDAILLWFALHGVAVLQKPARPDLLRLGPIDRIGAVGVLVHRLAGLTGPEAP